MTAHEILDSTPFWSAVCMMAGAGLKMLGDALAGKRKADLDQLQLALARLDKVEARCEAQAQAILTLDHAATVAQDQADRATRDLAAAREEIRELRAQVAQLVRERDALAAKCPCAELVAFRKGDYSALNLPLESKP